MDNRQLSTRATTPMSRQNTGGEPADEDSSAETTKSEKYYRLLLDIWKTESIHTPSLIWQSA